MFEKYTHSTSCFCEGLCKMKAEGDTYMTAFFYKTVFLTTVIEFKVELIFFLLLGKKWVSVPVKTVDWQLK